MLKSGSSYLIASIISSLCIGAGFGFWLSNSMFSFKLLSLRMQYQVLILFAILFGTFIYFLVFRNAISKSINIANLYIFLYLFSISILCVAFIITFPQSGTWTFWDRNSLENIQPSQGYAYYVYIGHTEFSYQQLGSSTPVRVLEDGITLPGAIADCQSKDIYTIGQGNVCFWDKHVIFSTSDNSDPRVNGRNYEVLYPINFMPIYIYTLAFLSIAFAVVSAFFILDYEKRAACLSALPVILVVSFPFIYLFPYIFPLNHNYISIGNDFHVLYYFYKVYLLDFLSRFHFPLWSPSEAAGFPFYSSPFSQAFYPFNILLAIYYRIAGGYTALNHQWFTVFGISVFALGLFLWLRRLKLNLRAVLFSTLILAVSFKVTEILRFPNAIHTAAWYPWVLYSLTGIFQARTSHLAWRYGMMLFFSLVCLLTGGYFYYAFYSVFLFMPYFVLFFIPEIRKTVFDIQNVALKRTFAVVLTTALAALVICAPYLYKTASLMRQTTDRGGNSYEYSTFHIFNFTDSIGSLFFPPGAQIEGIYYFGGVGVFLILYYVFSGKVGAYSSITRAEHDKEDKKHVLDSGELWLKIYLLAWIAVISYITYGRDSYLFNFLWHNMPLFSSLRVWGRMNIALVPLFAWLLALAYQYFEIVVSPSEHIFSAGRNLVRLKPTRFFTLSYGVILASQLIFLGYRIFDDYWISYVAPVNVFTFWAQYFIEIGWLKEFLQMMSEGYADMSLHERLTQIGLFFMIFTFLAFLILGFLSWYCSRKPGSRESRWAVWLILFTISIVNLGCVGPWLWAYGVTKVESPYEWHIDKKNMESFTNERIRSAGISLSDRFNVDIMENWYFDRYVSFLKTQKTEQPALDQLLGVTDGKKIYFSERIDYHWASEFLEDARRFQGFADVVSYTGDKLVVNIHAPRAGFLSFIDNWDEDWAVTVDGAPAPIYPLFGTFKSVQLTPGDHLIIFEYRPVFFR